MGLEEVGDRGGGVQVDLARVAARGGVKVVEVPITFVERTVGDSKMSQDIVKESLRKITMWGAGYRLSQVRSFFSREPQWHRIEK